MTRVSARERPLWWGQQIRCNSGADGDSPDMRERAMPISAVFINCGLAAVHPDSYWHYKVNQSMTNTFDPKAQRIAFIHASWHTDIVLKSLDGFKASLAERGYNSDNIDVIAVPGAYEIPLQAKLLAKTGRYAAIACSALVVDGGIYRHDFVAAAVCNGLMQVQLETEVPVLTAVLTPHHFHEHDEHNTYYTNHFVVKGEELANAADGAMRAKAAIA
jgi:6,7-dimethyl-8-ribityllumazine synthase